MKISGIYKIQSKIKPERIYIGSAINISNRWRSHINSLKRNKHDNGRLQNHFNKYGEVDLQFSILLGCPKEDLIKIEQYFLDSYTSWFNICRIAGNVMGGRKHTEETKQKMRKPKSEEAKANMRIGMKGKIYSEEGKYKLSIAAKKRKPYTEEFRQTMRNSWVIRKQKRINSNI